MSLRPATVLVPLACLFVGGAVMAQTGFLDNLWSDNAAAPKNAPKKKPATGKTDPWQPVAPSQAKPPEKKTKARKSAAPAPSRKSAPTAAPVAPIAPAQGAAPTAAPAHKIVATNWAVNCRPPGAQAKTCGMVQNVIVAKTKQRVLTLTVRPQSKAGAYALVLTLPHGLFLPAGVQFRIDDEAPVKWVIQTSDANGSYAGGSLADPLLGALKKGGTLKVSFASATRKVVSVPISLSGFTAAFAKLAKAQ